MEESPPKSDSGKAPAELMDIDDELKMGSPPPSDSDIGIVDDPPEADLPNEKLELRGKMEYSSPPPPPPLEDRGKAPAELIDDQEEEEELKVGSPPSDPGKAPAAEIDDQDDELKVMGSPTSDSGKPPAEMEIDPPEDEYKGSYGVDWRWMEEYFLMHEDIVSDGDDTETTSKKVQMFIEQALKCSWSKHKTMNYLYTYWGIHPAVTRAECDKLKQVNPQLFDDYNARKKERRSRNKAAAAALAAAINSGSTSASTNDLDQTPPAS